MSPRPARIAPQLLIREIAEGEEIEAFRTVRVADVDDPDLSLSFRSHYEEGLPPRYRQTQHAALHMAVSFWRTRERAVQVGTQFFPKHGEYTARVVFTSDMGIDCLDQAAEPDPEHLTIWGAAERLAAAVTDIVPLEP